MATLAGLATLWGTDAGEYNSAVYAYNADLANSFTHAHMDIMDKRHNEVASFNKFYNFRLPPWSILELSKKFQF